MLKISFCITCKNRFNQISKTLRQNLDDNEDLEDDVEFVLVDFGSIDGLKNWIAENFSKELNSGYLKYYYTENLKEWHCPLAKNTAHRMATGQVVVNLDCDNYTGKAGGRFVLDQFELQGEKIILHQASSNPRDGSFGRIAVMKKYFDAIGGYDESFYAMAYEDTDLIHRLMAVGLFYVSNVTSQFNRAIINDKQDSIKYARPGKSYQEMNLLNQQISKNNILSGNLVANNGIYGLRCELDTIC